jgi:seryl-tRNA synthetase
VGNDEAKHNTLHRQWGETSTRPGLLHHHELLWMIDGYEPERGVGVAGHRAYFLKGAGLLLNQALIAYGLSYLGARDYTPVMPPFFMNRDVMAGVAQLEDFDEQLYKVTGEGSDDTKYLIATSEQPLCAYHRGEWMAEKELPKRYAGYSACFRKEAGSHGRDTWGIFRVHQFDKVEQFIVCEPEESPAHHAAMVAAAEGFYQSLGLAYRVVNICSGELNNAAVRAEMAWLAPLAVDPCPTPPPPPPGPPPLLPRPPRASDALARAMATSSSRRATSASRRAPASSVPSPGSPMRSPKPWAVSSRDALAASPKPPGAALPAPRDG